jgi:hypothetical protein
MTFSFNFHDMTDSTVHELPSCVVVSVQQEGGNISIFAGDGQIEALRALANAASEAVVLLQKREGKVSLVKSA